MSSVPLTQRSHLLTVRTSFSVAFSSLSALYTTVNMSSTEDVGQDLTYGGDSSVRKETPTKIVNGVEGANCIKQCGSCASFRTATPDSTLGCPLEQAPRPLTIDPALRYRTSQEDPFMFAMQEQRKYHQRFEEDFQRLVDSQEAAKASKEVIAVAESEPEVRRSLDSQGAMEESDQMRTAAMSKATVSGNASL
jgi:hypothetical protein